MPNFWTTASQKIYEAFYGARTKDTEFELKVNEMKEAEKSVQQIKAIYFNFSKNTLGIRNMCKEVYSFLPLAYNEGSPYYFLISEIILAHKEIEHLHIIMCESIAVICKQTAEWDNLFLEAKKCISQRDSIRKLYDHYDEKMEKRVKIRNEKFMRGIKETDTEIESFDRNDLKYRKSTDEYVKFSIKTYSLIQELLDYRYKMMNPSVCQFVESERKFFVAAAELFKKMDNLQGNLQNIEKIGRKTNNQYNPMKYIRGGEVLAKNPIDKNVQVKFGKKTMQSSEYNVNNNTKMNYNQNKNNSDVSPNFNNFSYDEYLKKQGQNKPQKSVTPQPENIASNSNINIDNTPNPYSFDNVIPKKQENNDLNNYNINSTVNNYGMGNNSYALLNNQNNNFDDLSFPKMSTMTLDPKPINNQKNQVPDTFNPYSSLQFDNFIPNKNNHSQSQINNNRSQIPFTTTNPQPVNYNQMSMNYGQFPNKSQLNEMRKTNYDPNSNIDDLQFPK